MDLCEQNGLWMCQQEVCKKLLSRTQNLILHIESFHPEINLGDVAVRQKYKQYESDSSVPVPKSTKFWRKRKLRYLPYVYCKMRKYGALQIQAPLAQHS